MGRRWPALLPAAWLAYPATLSVVLPMGNSLQKTRLLRVICVNEVSGQTRKIRACPLHV